MKKIILFVILIVIVGGYSLFHSAKEKVQEDLQRPIPYPTTTPEPPTPTKDMRDVKGTTSLFVPYWALPKQQLIVGDYDKLIYFGISPGKNGIDMKEDGAQDLKQFLALVPSEQDKLLALRMTDSDSNLALLRDPQAQWKVVQDTVSIAKQNNFSGIVLDLELSALPFDSLVNQINTFTATFDTEAKKQNLSFAMTLYGDTFYRVRPFDVKTLAKNTDSFYLMAYDFSKANSNPGPNFPLNGSDTYGYDMTKMVDDFTKIVSPKKLTVVFGFFGYDWVSDDNDKALSQGKSITASDAEAKFVDSCQFKNCFVNRDAVSAETEVHYIDTRYQKHIVWFEDMDSVHTKEAYLKERGITSFSLWAYSYF